MHYVIRVRKLGDSIRTDIEWVEDKKIVHRTHLKGRTDSNAVLRGIESSYADLQKRKERNRNRFARMLQSDVPNQTRSGDDDKPIA